MEVVAGPVAAGGGGGLGVWGSCFVGHGVPRGQGNNNEGGRYLMVTDKPLRPRSCAGPIRAGVRRRDISRHYTSVCGYLLITGPSPRWVAGATGFRARFVHAIFAVPLSSLSQL